MNEYKVERQQWRTQPDPGETQKILDRMAGEGWRLVTAAAATGSGGGSTLLFFEREKK